MCIRDSVCCNLHMMDRSSRYRFIYERFVLLQFRNFFKCLYFIACLLYTSYTFRCIQTPGHTPGHTCLFMEKEKILFAGDHILFDITPNITMWRGVEDSLGNYLESLKKIRSLDIRLALPAHRKNDMDVYERIRQIEAHHDRRIRQTLSIIQEEPGLNACEIGARMTWSMRGKNWDEFPIQQKWFAIGETISLSLIHI